MEKRKKFKQQVQDSEKKRVLKKKGYNNKFTRKFLLASRNYGNRNIRDLLADPQFMDEMKKIDSDLESGDEDFGEFNRYNEQYISFLF